MAEYHLAVDIGASGGRHMLARLEDGVMVLEEAYRFENGMDERGGSLVWDTDRLFREIVNGMKRCAKMGKVPQSMSIDTWAVDYVLLDADGHALGETYGYRDGRTRGMDARVYGLIPEDALYARTGIQKQDFNTIYQLMADKELRPGILERAETFLMLPDYFQYLLTGVKMSEYTNATTTQLVSPKTKQWDMDLIRTLGYPGHIFLPLRLPGTEVGHLRKEVAEEVGFDCKVVLCGSHDTASAVMAVPRSGENAGDVLYLSSGTWSLMGVELPEADCGEASREANFTNEGGYGYRFRYLKNIMGLWMIQSVRHELGDKYSFAQLCSMAEECGGVSSRVDVNDACFLAPENMMEAIRDYCRRTGQEPPEGPGQIAAVIYHSLADCYGATVRELEKNTGRTYDAVYIIGGGSNADYLNRLTAEATGKDVYAGPGEATAIGNILAQMIAAGELADLAQARDCVYRSFEIKKYEGGS